MSFTNLLLGSNWGPGEWPEFVEVGHEGGGGSRRYVPFGPSPSAVGEYRLRRGPTCPAGLIEQPCDRGALLALADVLEERAGRIIEAARNARFSGYGPRMEEARHDANEWRCMARLIRDACGIEGEP